MKTGLIITLVAALVVGIGAAVVLTQESKQTPPAARIELEGEIEGVVDEQGHPIKTSALSNVGVGTYVFLKGIGEGEEIIAMAWEFTPPRGSAATLTKVDDGLPTHAYFMADVVGQYRVKLTVTDSHGTTGEATLMVNAGTYVGVGNVAGALARPPQCAICHAEQAASWAETDHASMFTRGVDGIVSSHYGESCVACHTVGYDETADNGGFDDVAARVGWTFPETLQPGNWDAIPGELKQLGNIGCENCHGPGSEHSSRLEGIATSLSADNCGFCHNEPWRHIRNVQWANSGHADTTSRAFTYPIGEGHESCVRCHSGEAFVDMAEGKEELRLGFQTITCAVCHDPHSAEHETQLRVVDEVTLPDGTEVTGVGASALCMSCHNGRRGPGEVAEAEPHYPHYSTAAEMITGTGGFDYGESVEDSIHVTMTRVGCVDCHMAATPGWADRERTQPLPGHDEVGAHTFNVTSSDGVENLAACTSCHLDLKNFNRTARADYDGNGTVEGIQDEVQSLLDLVFDAILASGVEWLGHYPYWDNVTTEAQKAAIFNWSFVDHDGSLGIHNTARAVQLLQRSYTGLTGEDVPGADLR
ncbi:MAG: multiheme c-type cytochrome [Candidatus Bipolaricaulia bacterium]